MLIDITTVVPNNSPLIAWAKSQDNQHVAMGHVGTHLDTYEKSNIPLEYFKSKGILFDVRDKAEVFTDDIEISKINKGDFVIFRTGQIEKYAYRAKEYFNDHPQLSKELIQALIEKQIHFIGMDCAGIRQHLEHEEADRLCEQGKIYVIENLCNLAKIVDADFTVYTMWLEDEEMTGLKCRVLIEQ
ncbi:Kynurenine formamidase [Peptoclostridium litorale DSM 5388]|uniref:Putative polyketide cyclase n=1 Tax=Peptoclostridium litorale DSM 5388 TaxID=1121324 RepID=A0A069RHJ9_PEPLI|nr:cyclase family protein [Peptoclostridium litorale]KDR96491.1 putative polyketide cyclase [Peptoclostridium litorale DSM 5388]SIN69969.1 Kynurenine formamidase [Peptoclostridium litorale DSM 5388]